VLHCDAYILIYGMFEYGFVAVRGWGVHCCRHQGMMEAGESSGMEVEWKDIRKNGSEALEAFLWGLNT
jgi:hypothetical protein